MALPSLTELVQELSQGPLLSAERRQELARLQAAFADARGLARELVTRGWLTPYQVNQLVQGRGRDLVLGPYVLLERLGEGGMGQVFKAHHTFLNRPVALKLISKASLSSAGAAERFLLEMQLVAQLDHPHIVRALDAGQAGDRYYLAMELIEGLTLARLVQQRGPLPVAQACACIGQAALGLQHASERGLVHRDIKPSNLMLAAARGGPPLVKVLDLGLARSKGGDAARDLTRTGTLMGTMDYLAPEQALDARAVDVRADIYSLGCTFFFLLAGRPPFHGGTEAQRLLQHQQQEPPAIESLRPDVPPAVAAILRRMLAKRPELRFQTPAEVAAALQPFASWDAGPAGDVSLIGQPAAAGERGWTLMVDPTRAPASASRPVATTVPAPAQTAAPGSSFGVPLTASAPPAAQVAPSLVTGRADAPERGWTLLAEPEPKSVPAIAVAAAAPPAPAGPTVRERLRRMPPRVKAVALAALLVLVGFAVGLALLLRPAPPSDLPVADNSVRDRDKGPGGEAKPPAPKEEALKGIRPLVIKPDQPMTLPRQGDVVFPRYPSGYFAMADRTDRDTFHVWDLTTMTSNRRFHTVSGMERPMALSPDGRWLAGKVGNKVRICDAQTGQVATLPLPEGRTDWLDFAGPDRLVTLRVNDPGRGLEVWDLKTQKTAFALPLPNGCAGQAAVSPDGQMLALPGNGLLVLQELRDNARATVLALPKQRGNFALGCRRLAFAPGGSELVGLFEEPFVGLRLVSWDVKRGAVSADHAVPKGSVRAEFFYPREGPVLEWLPGRKCWLLYGQALIDVQTGELRGAIPLQHEHRQHLIWVLTARYAVEVTEAEVHIFPLPHPKGG
jgi:serine/threonine-protein kinase